MLNTTSAEVGRKSGQVIFLDVPFNVCYKRIKGDTNRPIVMNNSKEQLQDIFNQRHEIYQANSSFKVDVNAEVSPFENARTINSLVKLLCK